MVRFFEHIDKIIYINLDCREDRNREIQEEFKRLQIPEDKIIRFSAIRHESEGAIGCSQSHIAVLKMAIENNWKNYMVLEDDFNFIPDAEFIDKVFDHFFTQFPGDSWDMLNLARGFHQDFKDTHVKYVQKVYDVSTTSGFLVNSHFYNTLLPNFIKGFEHLCREPKNHPMYCVDRYWNRIMALSNWYITNPSVGYQRTGHSSIGGYVVDYIQYDKTLQFGTIPFEL
jgi:glycosyl transferase, family 25